MLNLIWHNSRLLLPPALSHLSWQCCFCVLRVLVKGLFIQISCWTAHTATENFRDSMRKAQEKVVEGLILPSVSWGALWQKDQLTDPKGQQLNQRQHGTAGTDKVWGDHSWMQNMTFYGLSVLVLICNASYWLYCNSPLFQMPSVFDKAPFQILCRY